MRLAPVVLAAMLLASLGGCASGPPKDARRVAALPGYVVRGGDTLSQIAARFGVDMVALAHANRIAPPYLIRVGQRLIVPPGLKPAQRQASRPAVQPPPSPQPRPAALPRPVAPTLPRPPQGAPRLGWPADGPVSTSAGSGAGRGIVIAAHQGAAVRTAAAGTVVFAGPEPGPYGLRVLVDHGGGWLTSYGHLSRLVVVTGERVATGARVGFVGSTGSAPSPRLHFEVRRGGEAFDPLPLLPPRL